MLRTIFVVILFVIAAILIAYAFSSFFIPENKLRYQDCILLQEPETKKVDCFGCYNDICKDAPQNWTVYQAPEMGIPYACFKSDSGCQLAQ